MRVTANSAAAFTVRPAQLYGVLGIGVVAVSTASLFIRFAQNDGASSLVIAAWRLALATLILTPIVIARHRIELSGLRRGQIMLALLSGSLLGLHFATWISSLEYTSVLNSVTLVSLNPLFVAMATPLLLHDRLTRRTLIGIALAIVGGLIISAAGSAGSAPIHNAPLLGDGLALIGAVAVAGYFVIGRRLRASLGLVPYIWLTYGSAAIVLIAAVIVTGGQIAGLAPSAYLWMILLALLPQLIGHTAYNYALGHLSAAFVSLSVLGEPIGSTLLAIVLLSERPNAVQLFGSLFIFAALIVASRAEVSTSVKAAELVP